MTIHQDARVYLSKLDAEKSVAFEMPPGRHAWLQVLRGTVTLGGQPMGASDGAAVSDEPNLTIGATSPAEVMLFDLA